MLEIFRSGGFKKDQKRIRKRGYKEEKLTEIVLFLANMQPLPASTRNHKLNGNYVGHWECHIEPDWLLIYHYDEKILLLIRTGTHADLFDK
jgi:mRNA interferase YafQ